MSGVWAKYNLRLAEKPLQTKTMTSFTGFLLGDLVAQAPEISSGGKWDAWRTAKMGSFGLLLHGPIGHYWYGFLDRTIMTKAPTSALAVATKTGIDQILWAPIFTSGFFAYMKTADGKASEIPEEVQSKLWDTMKVNWMTWIPAHIVNFAFVPSSQRILYINTIQIGYNAFLSTQQAKTKPVDDGLASIAK